MTRLLPVGQRCVTGRFAGRCSSSSANIITPAMSLPAEDKNGSGPAPCTIVSQEVLHQRYLTLYSRRIRFDAAVPQVHQGTELDFDVIGHPKANFSFAVVFPFHPGTSASPPHVTLIREYCQGPHSMGYCLPTGGFDPSKHASIADCAAAELSEEALLRGGKLVRLVPDTHPGFAEVKWCANRFIPFLALSPEADANPGARDKEEISMQVHSVTVPELRVIMSSGEMMLPSITTAFLALQHLERNGLIERQD